MKPAPIMEEEEIEEEEEEEEMEDQEQAKKKERLAANAETIRSDCGEEGERWYETERQTSGREIMTKSVAVRRKRRTGQDGGGEGRK